MEVNKKITDAKMCAQNIRIVFGNNEPKFRNIT